MLCIAGNVTIGEGQALAVISGPCLLESLEMGLEVGRVARDACRELGLGYVFKASFDKANRSSPGSPRGPGLEKGLGWLSQIRDELGVPVTTDVHEPAQAGPVTKVASILQIPAFLCRQTDLLVAASRAAGAAGGAVNIKKGQFLSPSEMRGPIQKCCEAGCANLLLTERGTFFGYHRLVNDFAGVAEMMALGDNAPPVCFDATHSTQTPGTGAVTGGNRALAPRLARAAVAIGVHAVFLECHPDPDRAQSDAATQLALADLPGVLASLARVRDAIA